jgi:ketosteroid isomerase-like protein
MDEIDAARPACIAAGADYKNSYCGIFLVHEDRIQTVREYLDSGYAARTLFP